MINNLNPSFMSEIFEHVKPKERILRKQYKINLKTPKTNETRFGAKSLQNATPKIRNSWCSRKIRIRKKVEFLKFIMISVINPF